jgi:predicted ferric reductase
MPFPARQGELVSARPAATGRAPAVVGQATSRNGAQDIALNAAQNPYGVPFPRAWGLSAADLAALALGNGALIVGMWVRHGGLDQLGTLAGVLTAGGQLTALLGTYLALLGILLMSRSPWLDQALGADRLTAVHRWIGFGTLWLIGGHVVLTTAGYAMGMGIAWLDQGATFLTSYPYVLMAAVALGLFAMLAISSLRAARRRASYETWFGLHLYAYLAVALGFAHQLAVGTDFLADPLARAYWSGLYAFTAASVLVFRVGQPLYISLRHRLRVARVAPEAPGVVSVYVTGRDLQRLAVRSGQFFQWRFLGRPGWWRHHPFSLSAAPNGQYLRVTIKDLGDDTKELQRLRVGTPVLVEGPYGVLTAARRSRRRVLLIGAGIGIAPLRALLEDLPADCGDIALIYRARSPRDLVLGEEIEALARLRGATVYYLVGRRGADLPPDPLDASVLVSLVPDIREREVFLCGPRSMTDALRPRLRFLGLSDGQIHGEHFAR